jgi:hypothetical protein
LLCESLIHVLVEEGILTKKKAVDVIETVEELMKETSEGDSASAASRRAMATIERIARSFTLKD